MIAVSSLLVLCLLLTGGGLLVFRSLFGRWDPETVLPVYAGPEGAEEITFPSGDNTLTGWVWQAEDPVGLLVLCHGYRGVGRDHLAEAAWFLNRGWTVLCYDGTGAGESQGSAVRGFDQFRLDLLAALDWAETSPWKELPVVLYGHSAGGWAAATVLRDRPQVKGAVILSAFDTPVEVMYETVRVGAGPLAVTGYPSLWAAEGLLFGKEANRSAVDSINESGIPVLLVYGETDEAVPSAASLWGHREEVTSPAALWLTVSEEGRSGHSDLWFSPEGAAYRTEVAAAAEALAPADRESYLAGTDTARYWELDQHFMTVLDLFLRKCVKE